MFRGYARSRWRTPDTFGFTTATSNAGGRGVWAHTGSTATTASAMNVTYARMLMARVSVGGRTLDAVDNEYVKRRLVGKGVAKPGADR
jgi:hypothetical protein